MKINSWRSWPVFSSLKRAVRRLRFRRLHRPNITIKYRLNGSDYGAWPIIEGSLDSSSVVYSFGIGEDLSFDLETISDFGCRIYAFDPTPRSLDWVARQSLPSELQVHPYGLANSSRILRFKPPTKDEHVSYSAVSEDYNSGFVELPVHSLDWFMQKLGHIGVDYLKMDIEGSEYEVIEDILNKNIFPTQLCVEFHHGLYGFIEEDTIKAVEYLKRYDYKIFFVSDTGREYGFCRSRS